MKRVFNIICFVILILLIWSIACHAVVFTDCQQWAIKNWCKPAVNFKTWALFQNPTTQCHVDKPTIADANTAAVEWLKNE